MNIDDMYTHCMSQTKALKCIVQYASAFYADDRLPTLTLIGNDRQLNLHMATSMVANGRLGLCEIEKQAITRERKHFSEICKLKTFGV